MTKWALGIVLACVGCASQLEVARSVEVARDATPPLEFRAHAFDLVRPRGASGPLLLLGNGAYGWTGGELKTNLGTPAQPCMVRFVFDGDRLVIEPLSDQHVPAVIDGQVVFLEREQVLRPAVKPNHAGGIGPSTPRMRLDELLDRPEHWER